MAKSLREALKSNIAKKVLEKRMCQADYDKLLTLLQDEFGKLLIIASEFTKLYISQEQVCQFCNANLSDWATDLGFLVTDERSSPNPSFTLTIPEFTSGEGKKMTIAQKRLRTFNAELKARKKHLRSNSEILCNAISQKIMNGEFDLEDDEQTIVVYYNRPYGNILTNYEVSCMLAFFNKRKIQFKADCSTPGIYRFSL